jgi:drug/metabolite transporter (DMT)-like permease
MVMYFAYPVFVILINFIIYKNKITNSSLLAIFLLTASMFVLINTTGSSINFFGFTLGLLAALSYALYIVASKNNKLPVNLGALTVSLGSAVTCLMIALLDGSFAVPGSFNLWINIFGMSVICTTLPILFLLHALKYISSEKASLLSVTEPLFIIIISMIFLGEKINIIQAFGIALALTGVTIALINNQPEPEPANIP